MAWQVHQEGPIIDMNTSRLVGSMVPVMRPVSGGTRMATIWCVEIMWGGPGGDITYETDNYPMALAFILGVEAMVDRLTATQIAP